MLTPGLYYIIFGLFVILFFYILLYPERYNRSMRKKYDMFVKSNFEVIEGTIDKIVSTTIKYKFAGSIPLLQYKVFLSTTKYGLFDFSIFLEYGTNDFKFKPGTNILYDEKKLLIGEKIKILVNSSNRNDFAFDVDEIYQLCEKYRIL